MQQRRPAACAAYAAPRFCPTRMVLLLRLGGMAVSPRGLAKGLASKEDLEQQGWRIKQSAAAMGLREMICWRPGSQQLLSRGMLAARAAGAKYLAAHTCDHLLYQGWMVLLHVWRSLRGCCRILWGSSLRQRGWMLRQTRRPQLEELPKDHADHADQTSCVSKINQGFVLGAWADG